MLGTTPNDLLILFAERGAQLYAEELAMARRAESQWTAIVDALPPDDPTVELPPPEMAREAALLLRTGKFGC